jgi:hypothetical protein
VRDYVLSTRSEDYCRAPRAIARVSEDLVIAVLAPAAGSTRVLPILQDTYGDALDPRPRPGHRDRPGRSRPDLAVWVDDRGDGDALSIGGTT